MKSPLTRLNPCSALALLAALALTISSTSRAQNGAVPGMAPGAGAAYGGMLPPPTPLIDPVTGLPVQQAPTWKDPNWKDPEKVLADVSYDGLPLAEVAADLRKQFKDAFDVLIPNSWQNPYNPSATIEPGSFPVKMQLKNVTASEVFNAMNTVFEIENTPLRWELRLNGKRPMAVIRVLPDLIAANQVPAATPARKVFFVGDMVGDEKSGGMAIETLLKSVEEIYQLSYGSSGGVLQFHKGAQLLIVTGTLDQIEFVQQTLEALRKKNYQYEKARMIKDARIEEDSRMKEAARKAKADERKSP